LIGTPFISLKLEGLNGLTGCRGWIIY